MEEASRKDRFCLLLVDLLARCLEKLSFGYRDRPELNIVNPLATVLYQ